MCLLRQMLVASFSSKTSWQPGFYSTQAYDKDLPCARACDRLKGHGSPLPVPERLPVGKDSPGGRAGGMQLEELGLVYLPKKADGSLVRWDQSILDSWTITESAAQGTLEDFAGKGTSR